MSSAVDWTPQPAKAAPRRSLFGLFAEWIADFGALAIGALIALGDFSLFCARTVRWMLTRLPRWDTLLANFNQVGVLSLPWWP
jgi:ABC-type transporter Mla maintaining outer membrane lipid asymmetry permease subunit MlaE